MKAAASLTGSLLARKGAAYPASYSAPNSAPSVPDTSPDGNRAYNDPRVIASAPPTASPAVNEPAAKEELPEAGLERVEADTAAPCGPTGSVDENVHADLPQAMDKMGRVRLSVRLDPDRYLRVKMASARTRWSAQDIVIAALDRYLGGTAEKKPDDDRGGEDTN